MRARDGTSPRFAAGDLGRVLRKRGRRTWPGGPGRSAKAGSGERGVRSAGADVRARGAAGEASARAGWLASVGLACGTA